ncbi:hypothetical protein RYA07_26925 [Pseudomonas syringae pv. actinidiae]|nr:hypothetical protein [Pseudomonas syringae pv. actinidiae]
MSKKNARTSETPTFREWVTENRERLKTAFHKEFGRQIHEWTDFAEAAYAKAHTPKNDQNTEHTGEALNAAEIHR